MNEKQRVSELRERAEEFRSNHLIEAVFRVWRSQVKTPQENKSTLYTVFSGWKFYAKERSLLKKYLFECGESIGDMSMLTTLEVDNSQIRKSLGNTSMEQPTSNASFSVEKSLLFNYRDNFFTNPSLDPRYRKAAELHESLADRRLHR